MAVKKMKIEASVINGVLNLRVSGRIWQGELASTFKWEIDAALAQNISTAQLYLNTEGGSVFEAEEAINELLRLGRENVKITVGALAASAGTKFLCEFEAVAYKTSQFMIHKPLTFISGNEDQVKADLKASGNLINIYRSAYAKKFNMTEAQIDELWKNDYWMDAAEAKEKGLITAIIDEEIEVDETTVAMMVACGCPNVPKPKTKKENSNNNTSMDINQLRAALGMSATATEQEVLDRLSQNKATADQAAVTAATAKQKSEQTAETFVNKAILDKKITADQKPIYVSLHIQDPANTEALLNAMNGVSAASAGIKETAAGKGAATGRENWGIEDYLKNDPEAFNSLCETDPELVRKMNAAYSLKK
ncbi:ATP-dependent Clp protease proteolytic subunit [Chryseobacterium sp.]|uniref:ATP-dependent Clp protease proteolytic subunit n=1 Tax=Chryseobacterium sp. TaxID=1871047 RepID=UPI00289EE547|nr:ATP-dependent Clp protease proteolytic subunit [Chryseobacterium sp.]